MAENRAKSKPNGTPRAYLSDWLMNKALEDLQSGRDPFAATRHEVSPIDTEPPPPFCFRAAKLSFWLPLIASALTVGINNLLQGSYSTTTICIRLAALGVFALMILASFFFSIVALTGVREHGPDGLLWRGIRGVIANFVTMYLLVTSGIQAYHARVRAREAVQELQQLEQEALARSPNEKSGQAPEQGRPATASASPSAPASASGQTVKGTASSGSASGHSSASGTATNFVGPYTQKLQALTAEYDAASKALQDPPVLNMSGVFKRETILARKKLVRRFLTANEKLEAFVVNGEDYYQRELDQSTYTDEKATSLLEAYRKTAREKDPLTLKLRDADQRKASAMMGILDVLDSSWGRWKFDEESKRVLFDEQTAVDKYLVFKQAMDVAAADQKKLQEQLLALASSIE